MQDLQVQFNLTFDPDVAQPPITVCAELEPGTLLEGLEGVIRKAAVIPPQYEAIRFKDLIGPLRLPVTTGKSCYDPVKGPISINQDEPLVDYYKKYRARHHPVDRKVSRATMCPDNRITVGPASIQFQRTVRVPDTPGQHKLPAGLGSFPLADAMQYSNIARPEISRRGGLLMPMYQREAMWMSFHYSNPCAMKISVGEVNAVTGELRTNDAPSATQDYLTLPRQPWLDGICVSPGVVRQFVATRLGEGHTVEEQVTGSATHGGIQIDVFPSLAAAVKFERVGKPNVQLAAHRTPKELGVMPGADILMNTPCLPPRLTLQDYLDRVSAELVFDVICYAQPPGLVYVEVDGSVLEIDWPAGTAVSRLLELLQARDVDTELYCVEFKGRYLRSHELKQACKIRQGDTIKLDDGFLPRGGTGASQKAPSGSTVRGIAAGGRIGQKIYKDSLPPNIYDEENAERVCIHIVSPALWEVITGEAAPQTPIDTSTYSELNLPWFELYDEHKTALASASKLDKVQSVQELDGAPADLGPQCAVHPEGTAGSVLLPCGHAACRACAESAVRENACGVCAQGVDGSTVFSCRIKTQGSAGEPTAHMSAVEEADTDGQPFVVTLMLEDDRVSRLRGPLRR